MRCKMATTRNRTSATAKGQKPSNFRNLVVIPEYSTSLVQYWPSSWNRDGSQYPRRDCWRLSLQSNLCAIECRIAAWFESPYMKLFLTQFSLRGVILRNRPYASVARNWRRIVCFHAQCAAWQARKGSFSWVKARQKRCCRWGLQYTKVKKWSSNDQRFYNSHCLCSFRNLPVYRRGVHPVVARSRLIDGIQQAGWNLLCQFLKQPICDRK